MIKTIGSSAEVARRARRYGEPNPLYGSFEYVAFNGAMVRLGPVCILQHVLLPDRCFCKARAATVKRKGSHSMLLETFRTESVPVKSIAKVAEPDVEMFGLPGRIVGIYALLIAANTAAWIWSFAAFADQPVLLGTAVLAYSLGLRHAIDADHIATIDNVTRNLMQRGQRPVTVGFFFALGHSTVVMVASVAVAMTATAISEEMVSYREIGRILGTSASALFLLIIAIANMIVLRGVYRAFRLAERGGQVTEEQVEALLHQRGWLTRLFRPLFRFVSKSWHLYPIGLLFALGFETASEISLFGLSAQASSSVSSWSLLIFPALFAAGMTLVDTTDGVLMLGAYGWAYRNPVRKLYYNLTITSVSVMVALLVGGIETLGLIADRFGLRSTFWEAIVKLNSNFGVLGYGIVGLFAISWALSYLLYRRKGYDS